jgi:hypothetical protein
VPWGSAPVGRGRDDERLNPWVQAAEFDYPVRIAALRLLSAKVRSADFLYSFDREISEMLARPGVRDVLDCLVAMLAGGFVEICGGEEAAASAIAYEFVHVRECEYLEGWSD